MLNQDPDVRLLLAQERIEALRAAGEAGRGSRPLRLRLGDFLVRTGLRLAEGRLAPARLAG